MTKSLQVCFGESAAGSLRHAGFSPILVYRHSFGGPVLNFSTYDEYQKNSAAFHKAFYGPTFDASYEELFSFLTPSLERSSLNSNQLEKLLGEQNEICVWISTGFNDHMLLAFMIKYFSLLKIPMEKLKVREMFIGNHGPYLAMGEVSPEYLKQAPEPRALSKNEIELLTQGWEALTSPTPQRLMNYTHLPDQTYFQKGLKEYLKLLPSSQDGLNFYERELLKSIKNYLDKSGEKFAPIIRIVIEVFGQERLYRPNDLYIIQQLENLSSYNAKKPAILIQKQTETEILMKDLVDLTDFGQDLLDGKANWLEGNEIDYWVGGLHTSSAEGGALYFSDEILGAS